MILDGDADSSEDSHHADMKERNEKSALNRSEAEEKFERNSQEPETRPVGVPPDLLVGME